MLPALHQSTPGRICTNNIPKVSRPTHHHRTLHTSTPRLAKTRAPEQRTQKWDEEITARIITLVDPETNKLSEPRTRFDVLNTLDRKEYRLVQVDSDHDAPGTGASIPICKIVSKKSQFEQDRRKKKAQKEQAKKSSVESSTKTLELNWAIDLNDLGHRLDRMAEFLGEGRKVEIILAVKKRGRKASMAECQEVLKRIRSTVDGVVGAREMKDMQGKIGAFSTLFFQGSAQAKEV